MKINKENIYILRQYINEMNSPITNGAIMYILTGEEKYLKEHKEEQKQDKKIIKLLQDRLK